MNKLQKIIAFLCSNYPHKDELTKARLTKMVYLADWFSALLNGKQLTDIKWLFNHYGPYVEDVVEAANTSPEFEIENSYTMYGSTKHIISYNGKEEFGLSEEDAKVLKLVISKTEKLYFNDFVDYVYSTYPVKSKERYSILELETLAKDYLQKSGKVAATSH